MADTSRGRLIIVAGPSCVGKSPLVKALHRLHPDLGRPLQPLVLYNDREPRPGEIDGEDYYFRSRTEIEDMRGNEERIVMDVRGDLQALDMQELSRSLQNNDVLFEGNSRIAEILLTDKRLNNVTRTSLYVTPLSKREIETLVSCNADVATVVTDIMRRKLLRRTRRQKGELSLQDLQEVERRAGCAYDELHLAPRCDCVVANHDGEDSENWDAFPVPIGNAGRTLRAFTQLLNNEPPDNAEQWDETLLP